MEFDNPFMTKEERIVHAKEQLTMLKVLKCRVLDMSVQDAPPDINAPRKIASLLEIYDACKDNIDLQSQVLSYENVITLCSKLPHGINYKSII